MSDKVHGGTPKGSNSICINCRKAMNVRGINFQQRTLCGAFGAIPIEICYPIEMCSQFDDKRIPALFQMEQIAWEIRSRNRGPMGFAESGRTEITIEPPNRDLPQQEPIPRGKA